ncbi:zinc uptake protein ZrgA [Vibrio parahaemolyticus]|uniref:zinc uptake protein ZrgA n=1 Tax=Vibrio parahaemolyticus TaxID=670 RepID=UPI00387B140D
MPSKQVLAIVIGLSLSTVATAEEYRQHSAHVHGHVEFNIAQDGSDLLLEITAPGADVVGFEHAPENAEQEKTLQHAVATLEDSNALFAINPQAQCEIEEVHVEHSLGGQHEEHEHHDHEGHDHDEHAHHDHDKHEHDGHEGHVHSEHSDHGEFTVQYRFHCAQVGELSRIQTDWFNQFPSTESVNVNLFTDTTQSATSLTKSNTQIAIK